MNIINDDVEEELFFYHEFIDDESFPVNKKASLINDKGLFYIKGDYTIYQMKQHPKIIINREDFLKNRAAFSRILYNLPVNEVKPFVKFHYDKYPRSKKYFLEYVKYEYQGSTLNQGDKVLPVPPQKLILLDWLEDKINKKYKYWFLKSENLRWIITTIIAILSFSIGIWIAFKK